MTYIESAELMQSNEFRGRVKVACLQYANFIQIEPVATPGHTSRLKWAQQCFSQADLTANQIQPPTVMDPQVQIDGAAISDAALQSAVEGVVNKFV